MIPKSANQQDGFTRNFDALLDLPQSAVTEEMGHLSLVEPSIDPYAYNAALEHTPNHEHCPACQGANSALVISSADLGDRRFNDAGKFWMLYRVQNPELHIRTHEATQNYLNALGKFFSSVRLRDITPGHLRSYQIARLHNTLRVAGIDTHPWKQKAGHSVINHELCVLGQMLTFAKFWHRIKPYYFPLSQKSWSPRPILSEEDQEQLWKTASRHPEAALAYWVASITNNTTADGIELRGLRLKNLFLNADIADIYIPEDSVKNNSRPRRIPLNNVARWAIGECLKRAIKLGSCEPDHYLFPFRIKRNCYDPTRPASRFFLRKSWEKLQKATGFYDLNPHDLRHQCITRLLESDVNPETVMAIAGHVDQKTMRYYAHQHRRVKYAAVLAIESKKPVKSATPDAYAKRAG